MGRTAEKRRFSFTGDWLGMPLVIAGGFHWFRETVDLKPHVHKGFELTYASEGEATWVMEGGRELRLAGGSAALVQPDINHYGKWMAITPSRLFWLVITPEAPGAEKGTVYDAGDLKGLSTSLREAGSIVWRADEELSLGFEAMLEAMRRREGAGGEGEAVTDGRLAICRIVHALRRSLERVKGQGRESEFVEMVRKLMSESLAKPPSMAGLSKRLGISAAHFAERFKRESGMTPADYLRRLRCDKACEMLSRGELPITEIAFKLGFSTSQHFADVFKKYLGVSPREFRLQAARRQPPALKGPSR